MFGFPCISVLLRISLRSLVCWTWRVHVQPEVAYLLFGDVYRSDHRGGRDQGIEPWEAWIPCPCFGWHHQWLHVHWYGFSSFHGSVVLVFLVDNTSVGLGSSLSDTSIFNENFTFLISVFEDIFLFQDHSGDCLMQGPWHLGRSALVSIWFRIVLTQIIISGVMNILSPWNTHQISII